MLVEAACIWGMFNVGIEWAEVACSTVDQPGQTAIAQLIARWAAGLRVDGSILGVPNDRRAPKGAEGRRRVPKGAERRRRALSNDRRAPKGTSKNG